MREMSQVDNIIPDHIKSSLIEAEVDSDGEIDMERVPFAKNTKQMDMKQIDKNIKLMTSHNKENMNEDTDENQNRSVTPANTSDHPGQPLTPTANLKVLFNAVSPELRHRDEQTKESLFEEETLELSQNDYQFETVIDLSSSQDMTEADLKKYGLSRKEKSLGLLCQKFLQKYPEYPRPQDKLEICLDEVAKELQVERRRIYDIVNVLESVEIVSRVAKNKYAWHGKSNLCTTLAKLKALGDSEGFGEQIQTLKEYEFTRDLEEQLGKYEDGEKPAEPDFSMFGECSLFNQGAMRKDKSLGIMSQKFLMLFLVSKPRTVNLDLSAKLLIGDANIDRTENAKFKTKIRRLYDIANILTSLNLIRKVHVTEIRGRKPAFKYVGPDIDKCDGLQNLSCCSDGCHRPSSRHSMLDCIQNENVAKIMSNYKNIKPVNRFVTQAKESEDGCMNGKMARHSSFEQLCAVAAVETTRMNASAPSSPVKGKTTGDEQNNTHCAKKQSIVNGVIRGHIRVLDKAAESYTEKGMPTKGFVRKRIQNKISENQDLALNKATATKVQGAEAIIIKSSHKPACLGKQATVIPLTKEQIDAVLRSLKVPVPVSTENMEATTIQTSTVEAVAGETENMLNTDDMKELNEKTPVVSVNTADVCGIKRPVSPGDINIPQEKRLKLEFSSPVSKRDEKSPVLLTDSLLARFKRKSEVKPSPQRALHLTPEFVNPSQKITMAPSGDAPKQTTMVVSPTESPDASKSKKIEIIINESSPKGQPTTVKTFTISSPQASNHPNTPVQIVKTSPSVVHVPVLALQGNNQQRLVQSVTVPQQVQYVRDANGQILQITNTPSINSSSSGTNQVLSYALQTNGSNNFSLSNVQLVQAHQGKITNASTTLFRPVATKATLSPNPASQIVPPQQPKSSPTTLLHRTPGGFIPVSGNFVNGAKITISSPNSGLGDAFYVQKLGALS